MQTFLHYRWRVPSTLHRLHPRRIIPLLLLALCVTGAKAQTNVTFNDGVRYSQWVIESRLGDFYGNQKKFGFTTYDRNLNTQTTVSTWYKEDGKTVHPIQVDYVAGLVAKATIEAAEYYKAFTWAKPWFKSVEWYGNQCTVNTSPDNLDAINASKMYFGIYNLANGTFKSEAGTTADGKTTATYAQTQLGNALTALGNYNQEYKSDGTGGYAFPATTTVTLGDKSISLGGGWFHKKSYLHEMWLDGQYMGPATLAQLIKGYSSYTPISSNDWELITKQFSIVWQMCWDEKEQLLYHAFCSEARSKTWAANAEIWTTAGTSTSSWKGMSTAGHSAAFWGRAEGWYFLALVDVLEQMQKAGLDQSTNDNYSCYTTLKGYLDALALGIAKRQDETTGCWYQLIGKGGEYSAQYYNGDNKEVTNYLESSCTAIFAAAFLKATRLNLLSSFTDETKTYNYKEIGTNAYKGAVAQFMKQRTDGTVDLLGCCKSAGLGTATLGNAKFRDGSNAYYLHGYDVPPTSSSNESDYYTEGKVMGAFIMAATEYERDPENPKAIRFSYDLAPSYTLAQGKSITAEALGSGAETATYQWYMTDGTTSTAVKDATSATFYPTASGSYYCEAKSGSTTIKTSTTEVTVSGTSNVTLPSTNPVVWTFTDETLTGTLGTAGTQVTFTSTDGSSTVMTYVSGNSDLIVPKSATIGNVSYSSYLKENGSGTVSGRRRMEFNAPSSKGTVTIVYAGTAAKMTIVDGGNNNAQLAELDATQNTAVTSGELTTTVGNKIIIYCPANKSYIYSVIWTPINETSGGETTEYTVTLNATGVTDYPRTMTYSGTALDLPTPEKTGYTFYGWYTAEKGGNEVDNPYTPTGNINLYAQWTPITDLFMLTGVTSETVNVTKQSSVKVSSEYATITGGSAELHNGHSSKEQALILNSQINLNGSGSSYLKIKLDKSLQVGDKIIINPATSSFKLSAEESTSNVKTVTGSYVIQEGDAVMGKDVIFLYRGENRNSVIEDINITRYYPESDSRATFTYNGAEIAFSEETAGDKSSYTTTLEIGASKKGQTITITPSTKVDGATIKQGETVVSGNITITAPTTIGQTEKSTYTVTSKDGTSTTTYEINVTLVKENVVLEYAQREVTSSGDINIKKGWTWDTAVNPTQPDFDQPTLKVYLENADGTQRDVTSDVKGSIIYKSDVEGVATVDADGTITINKDANGGAKIYAILEDNDYYNDANTFFNIVVKQGYSYSVATDAEVTNGPSLNQPVYIKNGETNLVKMTFGGWKWKTFKENEDNPKLISTYKVNGSSRTDGWNKPATSDETEIASIDGYKTYISGYSDAVDESKEASKKTIYGYTRYGWFKPAETRTSDKYLETYPYTLPVRGAYMTFEPTQNGTLTVYILQNGAWNTFDQDTQIGDVLYKNGDIKPGEFRPHSFYICNQRGLNADQFSPNTFTYTTKQKVQGDYYCNLTNNTDDPYNIASWNEFKDYMSADERQAVEDNWNNGINGGQSIVQLDNGSFLAIQKGIVKYTFFVTANETYYLFSNFSKLGFCGANFVPSKDIIPADDAAHKITLSDETAYPKPVKVTGNTDEDKNKYAWNFGDDIKGYVNGFTIPLFKSITLNRTFKKGQWTTLTLPFNLTQTEVEQIFGKGTQILVFQDAQTEGTKLHIKFFYHEIQNILPGYPYLIKPTLEGYDNGTTTQTAYAPTRTIDESGDLPRLTSFTVYDKAINPNIEQHEFTAISPGESYVAKGTPGYCTADENGEIKKKYEEGDLFISDTNGKLYISKGSSYGKGYRSYIDGPASSATKTLSLSFSGVEDGEDDGTTTEISVAELADDVIEAFGIKGVYNLNGQKVSETTRNLPAGIYVVNGRKVVVK